ncbi:MAG: branched-chain amino acid transporter ATPase [Marmoricola sp.]|nr:branched-chain amino acid transporter ATPase [Marmoricola sp.]
MKGKTMGHSTDSMLEVVGLTALWGTARAVENVSFSVGASEGIALLGRNGMGKSTTLRSLLGVGPHVQGLIRMDGQDLRKVPPHRRARSGMSLVFEDRKVLPHITVDENIRMGRRALSGRKAPSVDEIYAGFPLLHDLRDRIAGNLSGGEQQMLVLARAVASAPRVLLLDEPVEGLAPVVVEQLVEAIRWVRANLDLALVVAEHKLWFTRQCTERVLVLVDGSVAFEGTWAEFDADPRVESFLTVA